MSQHPFAEEIDLNAIFPPETPKGLDDVGRSFVGSLTKIVMYLLNSDRYHTFLDGKIRKIVGETPVVHKVSLDGYQVRPLYGSFKAATPNRLAMGICTVLGLLVGIAIAFLWHSGTVTVQMGAEVREVVVQSVVDLWWFKIVIVIAAIIAGRVLGTTFTRLHTYHYVNGTCVEKIKSDDDETVPAPPTDTTN